MQAPASASTHVALTRAAAATSCLGRPRDFSSTPNRTFNRSQTWADKSNSEGPALGKNAGTQTPAPADDSPQPKLNTASREEDTAHAAIDAAPVRPSAPIRTDLVLPPAERTVAPRADDLDPEAEGYRPAYTADGLEVVGGLEGWFAEDKNHWGASKKYVGFAPPFDKDIAPAVMEVCAIRAVLEAAAVAARESARGKRRAEDKPETILAATWRHGGREGLNRALQMKWSTAADGTVQVGEGSEAVARALLKGPEDTAVVREEEIPAEEAKEILKKWDRSWKKISLQDVKLKFAVWRHHPLPARMYLRVLIWNTVG